jgi:spore coat protein U-like protein
MNFFLLMITMMSFAWADPECDYQINLSSATIEARDLQQVVQQEFSLQRGQNSPAGRCRLFRVFFNKGQANSYQRRATSSDGVMNYNIHRNINLSGILKDFGDALNENEYLQGEAPEKLVNYTTRYYLSLPGLNSQGPVPSGMYVDTVQVTVYGFNESSGRYLFSTAANFLVTIIVPHKIEVSLIDEGGVFDPSSTTKVMDFGHLKRGQQKGVDLRVVANTPYQVYLSSSNNGVLKLPQKDQITYQLRVNNIPLPLKNSAASPVNMGGSAQRSRTGGDLYNLKVEISDSIEGKKAGTYQDVITLTAIAN